VGRGEGANERGRRVPEGFSWVIYRGGELGLGWFHRKRLGVVGGFWGRRSALSAGVGVVVSVATRLGRKPAGFNNVAGKMVRGGGASVHGDAR
jgi:hypothetical protein